MKPNDALIHLIFVSILLHNSKVMKLNQQFLWNSYSTISSKMVPRNFNFFFLNFERDEDHEWLHIWIDYYTNETSHFSKDIITNWNKWSSYFKGCIALKFSFHLSILDLRATWITFITGTLKLSYKTFILQYHLCYFQSLKHELVTIILKLLNFILHSNSNPIATEKCKNGKKKWTSLLETIVLPILRWSF